MYTIQYENKYGIIKYRKVYSFDDLSQEAKQEAIRDCRERMLEDLSLDGFTIGDTEFDNVLNNDDVVIELIKANDYSYDKDGLRI